MNEKKVKKIKQNENEHDLTKNNENIEVNDFDYFTEWQKIKKQYHAIKVGQNEILMG